MHLYPEGGRNEGETAPPASTRSVLEDTGNPSVLAPPRQLSSKTAAPDGAAVLLIEQFYLDLPMVDEYQADQVLAEFEEQAVARPPRTASRQELFALPFAG